MPPDKDGSVVHVFRCPRCDHSVRRRGRPERDDNQHERGWADMVEHLREHGLKGRAAEVIAAESFEDRLISPLYPVEHVIERRPPRVSVLAVIDDVRGRIVVLADCGHEVERFGTSADRLRRRFAVGAVRIECKRCAS